MILCDKKEIQQETIIKDMLKTGQKLFVSGNAEEEISIALMQLTAAIARGDRFWLGNDIAKKGKVLYINTEIYHNKINDIFANIGLDCNCDNITIWSTKYRNHATLRNIKKEVNKVGDYVAVIIDSIVPCFNFHEVLPDNVVSIFTCKSRLSSENRILLNDSDVTIIIDKLKIEEDNNDIALSSQNGISRLHLKYSEKDSDLENHTDLWYSYPTFHTLNSWSIKESPVLEEVRAINKAISDILTEKKYGKITIGYIAKYSKVSEGKIRRWCSNMNYSIGNNGFIRNFR